jgi:hypothetical protein
MATLTTTAPPTLPFPSSTSTSTASCTTAIPGRHGYVPPEACNANWSYDPSFTAAIVLAILFGMLTFAHLTLAIIYRKRFCWVIVMATAWEFAAFILRAAGSRNQQSEALSTASQLLFLLAPLWINAFVYMTAGRLIYTFHPNKRVWAIKAISLGKWFVWLDIVSFLIQATGGTMLNPSNDEKTMDLGKKIYMSGVGVQQGFIILFLALIVKFHMDALALDRQGLLPTGASNGRKSPMWKWLTYSLYVVLALITMRIVFRLVEFSGGVDPANNKLPFEEKYALGLDAFPMVLAVLILAVLHPGMVLKGPESEFPTRKERKAEKKAVKAEKKEMKKARREGRSDIEMNASYARV